MTSFICSDLGARQRYNLLTNIVIPRPIALVTTVDKAGVRNAAPFSFFNAVCGNPPTVILGINRDDPVREKDTVANIQDTGEFVVNFVAQKLLEKMTVCEVDVPAHVDELNLADLEVEPSATVSVPRLVQTPSSLECRLSKQVSLGAGNSVIFGEVLCFNIDDRFACEKLGRTSLHEADILYRLGGPAYGVASRKLNYERISGDKRTQLLSTGSCN